MGLKDAMKQTMNAAKDGVQGAIENGKRDASERGSVGIAQGLMGNYTEMPIENINKDYGMYLMKGEQFVRGFSLVRDKMLFTDRRIIFIDHQGATGVKMRVESIALDSIIEVVLEMGGLGFDHAELEFYYIGSPYYRGHDIVISSHKLDFPNGFDVQSLYADLLDLAYRNVQRINS